MLFSGTFNLLSYFITHMFVMLFNSKLFDHMFVCLQSGARKPGDGLPELQDPEIPNKTAPEKVLNTKVNIS